MNTNLWEIVTLPVELTFVINGTLYAFDWPIWAVFLALLLSLRLVLGLLRLLLRGLFGRRSAYSSSYSPAQAIQEYSRGGLAGMREISQDYLERLRDISHTERK